jgi:hypothetical protein
MKNSIGKPYEREVHVRFDEGGADSLFIITIFMGINFELAIRLYSTLHLSIKSI